jgi:hypothetical protein
MLRDVISAVAEFMVRVLHSRSAVEIHDVSGVEARPDMSQQHALWVSALSYQCHHAVCLLH